MSEKVLIIGDLHHQESRMKAITTAVNSILNKIKSIKFDRVILLGDLFHTKPSSKERESLANFILKLRQHTKRLDFIIGNGKHTFENNSIHESDWITLCSDFFQHEELKLDKYVFGHYEVKGTKYINGHLSNSNKEVSKTNTYILGHVHSPECSFNNIHYVGSIYKVSFSEINDNKRIAILENNKITYIPIESRPMYQITLQATNNKIKSSDIKQIVDLDNKDIDLKIVASSDEISINKLYEFIQKIKSKFNIEYYKEDIQLIYSKQDVPESLDRNKLLKKYCKDKEIDYTLIEKTLKEK